MQSRPLPPTSTNMLETQMQSIMNKISIFKQNSLQQYEIDHEYQKIKNTLEEIVKLYPNRALTLDNIQPLIQLLNDRHPKIFKTEDDYPQNPLDPINMAYLALAQLIEEVAGVNRYQLLMPTLTQTYNAVTDTHLTDYKLQLRHFILSDEGDRFIEVIPSFEFGALGIWNQTSLDKKGHAIPLTDNEKKRLINHSEYSLELYNAIKAMNDEKNHNTSFGALLTALVGGLRRGGNGRLSKLISRHQNALQRQKDSYYKIHQDDQNLAPLDKNEIPNTEGFATDITNESKDLFLEWFLALNQKDQHTLLQYQCSSDNSMAEVIRRLLLIKNCSVSYSTLDPTHQDIPLGIGPFPVLIRYKKQLFIKPSSHAKQETISISKKSLYLFDKILRNHLGEKKPTPLTLNERIQIDKLLNKILFDNGQYCVQVSADNIEKIIQQNSPAIFDTYPSYQSSEAQRPTMSFLQDEYLKAKSAFIKAMSYSEYNVTHTSDPDRVIKRFAADIKTYDELSKFLKNLDLDYWEMTLSCFDVDFLTGFKLEKYNNKAREKYLTYIQNHAQTISHFLYIIKYHEDSTNFIKNNGELVQKLFKTKDDLLILKHYVDAVEIINHLITIIPYLFTELKEFFDFREHFDKSVRSQLTRIILPYLANLKIDLNSFDTLIDIFKNSCAEIQRELCKNEKYQPQIVALINNKDKFTKIFATIMNPANGDFIALLCPKFITNNEFIQTNNDLTQLYSWIPQKQQLHFLQEMKSRLPKLIQNGNDLAILLKHHHSAAILLFDNIDLMTTIKNANEFISCAEANTEFQDQLMNSLFHHLHEFARNVNQCIAILNVLTPFNRERFINYLKDENLLASKIDSANKLVKLLVPFAHTPKLFDLLTYFNKIGKLDSLMTCGTLTRLLKLCLPEQQYPLLQFINTLENKKLIKLIATRSNFRRVKEEIKVKEGAADAYNYFFNELSLNMAAIMGHAKNSQLVLTHNSEPKENIISDNNNVHQFPSVTQSGMGLFDKGKMPSNERIPQHKSRNVMQKK